MNFYRIFALVLAVAMPGFAEPVTYSKDVAPIFFEHCAMCHRPGEVAPMSLLNYESARPWAKSIARAVAAEEMPPWSGESEHHQWSNDISLTDAEKDTIIAWVEQGAKQGNPADLPETPSFPDGWTLGEPDYIIELSPVDVPTDGEDLFPQEFVKIDLDEEHWIQAIEFLPGDRRVTHHFQATYNNTGMDQIGSEAYADIGILSIWTAGMPPYVFPKGMGRIVAKCTTVLVDSHYHPFGEATTDQTKIGLYFGEGELQKQVATLTAVNTGLRIPPGAPHHAEHAYHHFDRDMQILAFSPHMHVRGKAMKYDLIYPDGRTETLLDVPKYNYNWQWLYYPTEPIDAPKGSKLHVTAVWDNSENNPHNPDPSQEIIYRGDTFNEMFVGFVEAIQKDGVYMENRPAKVRIAEILEQHPAEDSYFIGGFLPFGMYVPKEGEGWLYLANGSVMFTTSLDDITWSGNTLKIVAQLPTPEASATLTIVEGELDEQGRLKGSLHYGIDSDKPLNVPIIGQPMAKTAEPAKASGGR